jgi:hypothetical protein
MRVSRKIIAFACLGAAALLLSGCGKDFTGFGEFEGWGGSTKGFGDIDGYGNKQVGLCSYTGGCMPDSSDEEGGSVSSYKSSKRGGDTSGAGATDQ